MTLPARYENPITERIFSNDEKIKRWWSITRAYMVARLIVMEHHDQSINADAYKDAIDALTKPTHHLLIEREKQTGHDFVAFLSLIEDDLAEVARPILHYGLTSSDVVDNAHFWALHQHLREILPWVAVLADSLGKFGAQHTRRAGRTHGQIGDPTSWNWQMRVFRHLLDAWYDEALLLAHSGVWKSAGPVGNGRFNQGVDGVVVRNITLQFGAEFRLVPSTQVIPRDHQVRWAALYLRLAGILENLALQVRLGSRSDVGEVREGGAEERVGSSAMPHKKNPIDSEKVCALARVARGHFSSIAESTALWEDRDLTNSALERVAVPGLAGTVEHMLITMRKVMENLVFDAARASENIDANPECWSATMQTLAQKHFGMGPIEASQWVRRMFDGYTGRYRDEGYFLGYMQSRVSNSRADYEPFIEEFKAIVEDD